MAERFAALRIILFSSVTQKECVWFQAATKAVEAMKHVVHPNYRPPSRRTHFLQRFDEKLAWPDQVMIGVQIWAWCSPTYKHTHDNASSAAHCAGDVELYYLRRSNSERYTYGMRSLSSTIISCFAVQNRTDFTKVEIQTYRCEFISIPNSIMYCLHPNAIDRASHRYNPSSKVYQHQGAPVHGYDLIFLAEIGIAKNPQPEHQ